MTNGGVLRVSESHQFAFPHSVCPGDQPAHICSPDMCSRASCEAHPTAVCRINPCGGCSPQFYNADNELVNCQGTPANVILIKGFLQNNVIVDFTLQVKHCSNNYTILISIRIICICFEIVGLLCYH